MSRIADIISVMVPADITEAVTRTAVGEIGSSNEDTFEGNLTVDANTNMMIAGPITVPNITVNGNLSITNEVDITTGDLNVSTNGSLSVIN